MGSYPNLKKEKGSQGSLYQQDKQINHFPSSQSGGTTSEGMILANLRYHFFHFPVLSSLIRFQPVYQQSHP